MASDPDRPARPDNPYSRLNYRRLIAWPQRIAREWPLLEREISAAPELSVLDLGCGTGEHARHAASQGVRALGVDRSEQQITSAREYEDQFAPHGPRFLLGEFAALDRLTEERFGAAICLGNVLPHLEDDALATMLRATASRLLPGGRVVLQWLNYERIVSRSIRNLPVNFRDSPDSTESEIVFLRLMTPDGDRHVLFYPTTLALTPGNEPPITVEASREVRLRAWRRGDVEDALASAGFEIAAAHGDMVGSPFDPGESTDVVLVAVADRAGG